MSVRACGKRLPLFAVVAVVAAACSGSGQPGVRPEDSATSLPATPTQSAARTPSATATPDERLMFRFAPSGPCPFLQEGDLCEFALAVAVDVRSGETEGIINRATPLPVRCPDIPQTTLFGSVCEAHWGQQVAALYAAKWGGGAAFETVAQMGQAIADRLDEPAARRAVVGGVGCSVPACDLAVAAIVLPSTDGDGVLLFELLRNAGAWGIVGMLNWFPSDPFVRGESAGLPIAFPELRTAAMALTFQPWTPP